MFLSTTFSQRLHTCSTPDRRRQKRIFGFGLGACGRVTGYNDLPYLQILAGHGGICSVGNAQLHFQGPDELTFFQPNCA
jgi:hypothetical protein